MTAEKLPAARIDSRVWQRMLSGRRLDLMDPSPLDIEIADIAHGLARVARWNGQTSGAHIFSVAQHTLLVEAVMCAQSPRIDTRLRTELSPRHVPDTIAVAPVIPRTLTGKKLEIPVKAILQGTAPDIVAAPGAIDHPEALAWFARWAADNRTSA